MDFLRRLPPHLTEARDDGGPREAADPRSPFFFPVSILLDDGRCFSAFSRDLSASGIGLLHCMELPLGEVDIRMTGGGYSVKVRARILWCKSCGEGWYISGGTFASPFTATEM
jgi:hypothetical protein